MRSSFSFGFFERRAHGPSAPNLYYTTSHAICQQAICTNFHQIFFPILCILTIDFWVIVWYNIISQEGKRFRRHQSEPTQSPKNFSKTFEKPLDKTAKVWYNIYSQEGMETTAPKVRE